MHFLLQLLFAATLLLSATFAFAQPSNDDCSNATPVPINAGVYCNEYFTGSTYDATGTATDCSSGAVQDVWYQFVATSHMHGIQFYGYNGFGIFGFEVLEGDCSGLISRLCTDSLYVTNGIIQDLSVGATYYIRVFSSTESGYDFYGCISTFPPPPSNDECIGATVLSVNESTFCNFAYAGSTLGATHSEEDCFGTQNTHDVWYSFEATGTTHRLEVTQTNTILGGYNNLGYAVYSGNCGALSDKICQQFGYTPTILTGLVPGNTYYLRVFSTVGSAHAFNICLQTVPPPPANITFASAQVITPAANAACESQTSGTTAGVETFSPSCYFGSGMGVWYSFTATANSHIIRVSNVQYLYGAGSEYWLEVLTGADSASQTSISCNYYPGNIHLNELVIGQTYYIRWLSGIFNAHTFDICIGTVPTPPNNDCVGAIPLTVDPDLSCDSPIGGTTAGSTAIPGIPCPGGGDVWYQFIATQAAQQIALSNITDFEYGYSQYATVELLTGSCGNLTSIQCLNSANFANGNIVAGELVAGQTYYLRVASQSGSPINFNLCILTPPPPPANDGCVNAVPLNVDPVICGGTTAGTTLNATASPNSQTPPCCGSGDVWYSFVATQPNHEIGLFSIEDANYPGSLASAQIALYAGCQQGAVQEGVTNGYNGFSWLVTHLTPGATYYIQVAGIGYYPSAAINFEICVSAPPVPVNDECAGALPLPINDDLTCQNSLIASTYGATQSAETSCYSATYSDVWYQFTATTASYRMEISLTNGTFGEWGFEILTGSCSGLTSIRCESQYYYSFFSLQNLTIGETYYLRLYSNRNSVQEFYVCTRALPLPPANDNCAGATALTVNPDMSCSLVNPGSTLGALASDEVSCNGAPNNDVWYSFVATSAAQLLQLNPTFGYFGGTYDLGFQLYSGDCNNLNNLYCLENQYNNNNYILNNLTIGETYYLRLFSVYNNAHDFTLCLQTLPPPPANDACAQATPVTPNPDLNCTVTYPGTTLSATSTPGSSYPDVWYSFTATSPSYAFDFFPITTILGYDYQIAFEIYQGTDCDNLVWIANNSTYSTAVSSIFQPGQTYFVRVYSTEPNAAHNFNFCIRTLPPSPPNETCAGAFEVTPNTGLECTLVLPGTNAGSLEQSYYSCGYGNDVWYKFTATAPIHWVQLNNLNAILNNGGIWMEVLQSADCSTFNNLYCVSYNQTAYLTGLNPGETYYIRVACDPNTVYSYDLCIQSIFPPANDDCANATALDIAPETFCSNDIAGTTLGANSSGLSPCNYDGYDVWYSFTATQAAHSITVTDVIDAQFAFGSSFGMEVYSGNCDNLNNLYCRHNLYISDNSTVGELIPGETYYIRVISYYSSINLNICVSTPPPPPANDGCAGATVLTPDPDVNCDNPTSGTTLNATISPGTPYYGYTLYNPDVWYAFSATQSNHLINIGNLVSQGSGYNVLVVELYAGVCGAFSTLIQQYFYSDGQVLVTNLTPGTTYYLRIYDQYNQPANFNICITSPPAPANDLCENAFSVPVNPDITCAQQVSGTTYGATSSAPVCPTSASNDVWYKFQAQSSNHRLDFAITGGNNYFFGVEVLEGACGEQSAIIPCTEYYYGNGIITLSNLTIGQSYFIRVYSYSNYYLNFNLCLRTLPSPPANDACSAAVNLPVNSGLECLQSVNGTTLGATASESNCYGWSAQDVWYKFTATNERHLLKLNVTEYLLEPNGFAGMAVYAGDCESHNLLYCTDYPSNPAIQLNGLQVGATYYVQVFSGLNTAHHFTLCVGTIPPPPVNDLCNAAVEVKPKSNLNCNQAKSGTTAGLIDYSQQGCFYGTDVWYWFEANSPIHLIQFSDMTTLYGNGFLGLELYHGNNCEALQLLNCTAGQQPIYATNLIPGDKYYIRVVGSEYGAAMFDLCVVKISPPSNDACSNAQSLNPANSTTCQNPKAGSTLGAGASSNPGNCSYAMDVWYSFVASSTTHQINLTDVVPYLGYANLFLEVYSGNCGSLVSLGGCFYAYYPVPVENLTPGQKYYIRVGSYDLYPAAFNICVTTLRPDLTIVQMSNATNGCAPGNNENVDLLVVNNGQATVPAGAANVTLKVTGANPGQYGPVANLYPIYPGSSLFISIPNVNLSNTGASTLKGKVSVSGDSNPNNNDLSVPFTTLPLITLYFDADGDGYGNPGIVMQTCYPPVSGFVTAGGDCNDSDAAIHPGATELCDNVDNDCNGIIDDCILISGTVRWEHNNAAVNQVKVNLSGDASGNYTTGTNGVFQFEHLSGHNFTLQPKKNINLLNGVTVADANLVRRKAQGQNVLNNPYKLIAADVDKNNAITMADYNLLIQTISNPGGSGAFSPSWRFVPSSYSFPNPQAPWGFPQTITLTGINSDQLNQDFIGVKLGDVNGSGNPAQKTEGALPLVWQVTDQPLVAGELITAIFQVSEFTNLAAWQFALQFDPEYLEWNDVEGLPALALTPENFGTDQSGAGILTAIWDDMTNHSLPPGTGVFHLQFKVRQGGVMLSQVLRLSNKVIPALAYNLDLAAAPVELVFTNALNATNTAATGTLQLLQNQPNPFTNQTRIGFVLPEAGEATLNIYDAEGRLLWQDKRHYAAGYQERSIHLENPAPAGILYYELVTSSGILSRKMARMIP